MFTWYNEALFDIRKRPIEMNYEYGVTHEISSPSFVHYIFIAIEN